MVMLHHSCGFVIYFENSSEREYLLLRYPEGHVDLVKGHREAADDSLLMTAKRELLEETGISDVEVNPTFEFVINYEYVRDKVKHKKRVDFFLGKVGSQKISISHEHTEFFWAPYNEALQKITFDNARDVLIAAESCLRID